MSSQVEAAPGDSPAVDSKKGRRRRGGGRFRRGSGKGTKGVPKIFGVPTLTRDGKPKSPIDLLFAVVGRRLPTVKLLTYEEGEDGTCVSYCIVGSLLAEARGTRKDSRRDAIRAMLNKLGHHSESGYASENAPTPSTTSPTADNSRDSNQQRPENTQEGGQGAGELDKAAEGDGEVDADGKRRRRRSGPRSEYVRLRDIAEEMFPPVKYEVVRMVRSPSGPIYVTRCAVRHFVTYGEAGGDDGKELSMTAAAEVMLERLKTLSPIGSEEENYQLINQPVVKATYKHRPASEKDLSAAKKATNRVLQPFLAMLSRADRFFSDFFVKAFFGGSFYDRILPGEDYEVFLIFWRANNVIPINRVHADGGPDAPKLHVTQRDNFSRALAQMGFLAKRDGDVLPFKFADWFHALCKAAMRQWRGLPDLEVTGYMKQGCYLLKIKEPTGHEFEVKLHPCFAFPTLDRLPCCTIDLAKLGHTRKTSSVVGSEWYAVPERVTVAVPRRRSSEPDSGDDGQDEDRDQSRRRGGTPSDMVFKRMTRWSFVAPAGESAALHDTDLCKPLLRVFLDLNQKLSWDLPAAGIKNMFIDEALLHQDFDFWAESDAASLFMMMLGKLESCLDSGVFPTLWESNMIRVDPRQAAKVMKDVGWMRRTLLQAYRRVGILYDSPPSSDPADPETDFRKQRGLIFEEVFSLLLGDEKNKPVRGTSRGDRRRDRNRGDGGRRRRRRRSEPSRMRAGDGKQGEERRGDPAEQ